MGTRRHHICAPKDAPERVPKAPKPTAAAPAIGPELKCEPNVGHRPLANVNLRWKDRQWPVSAAHAAAADVAAARAHALVPAKGTRPAFPCAGALGAVIAVAVVGVEAAGRHQGQERELGPTRDATEDTHPAAAAAYEPARLIKAPVALELNPKAGPRVRHDDRGEKEGGRPRIEAFGVPGAAPLPAEGENHVRAPSTQREPAVGHGDAPPPLFDALRWRLGAKIAVPRSLRPTPQGAVLKRTAPLSHRVTASPYEALPARWAYGIHEGKGPVRRVNDTGRAGRAVAVIAVRRAMRPLRGAARHPLQGRVSAARVRPLPLVAPCAEVHVHHAPPKRLRSFAPISGGGAERGPVKRAPPP